MTNGKHDFIGNLFGDTAIWLAKSTLVSILNVNLIMQPAIANAQMAPDLTVSANEPEVTSAQNGVPVVNIVAPTAAGVSHNKFTDFNVSSSGVVLNNSAKAGVSQLGGALLANPKLGGREASIILNEVTGSNRSSLKGFTEIFGNRAQYVLANPNGITCSGCGFINTSRTTLTTGNPDVTGGQLNSIDVDNSATISIEGSGLNAQDAAALDLVARTVRFNAPVHANDLKAFTGRNLMDYGARTVTAKADNGSAKPALAIDGSLFGAMYAGQIEVIATEQGVGVRMPDTMAEGLGDLIITADGGIDVSKMQAKGDIALAAKNGNITLSDNASASGAIKASTDQDIVANNVTVAAATDVTMRARNLAVKESAVVAGTGTDGSVIDGQGTLDLKTSEAIDFSAGKLAAGKNLVLDAATITGGASDDGISSGGDLSITASVMDTTKGGITANGNLDLKIASVDIAGTVATTGNRLSIQTEDFVNNATISSNGDVSISTASAIVNDTSGTIRAGGSVALTSTANSITNRGTIGADQDMELIAATSITNEADASILADQNMVLETQGGTLTNNGTVEAKGTLDAKADGDIVNANGAKMASSGNLTTTATGTVTNNGQYSSAAAQQIAAANLVNNGGLYGQGDLTADITNDLTTTGILRSDGQLTLNVANNLVNDEGKIRGKQGVMIRKDATDAKTASVTNISGEIIAGTGSDNTADMTIHAADLTNRKKAFAVATRTDAAPGENSGNTTVSYQVQYVSTDSESGQILADRDITLDVDRTANSQSRIQANRNLDVTGTDLTNETRDLTTTRVARTQHVRTWKKCKWHGSCKHYSETYYTTNSQLQADKTQTQYGVVGATENLDMALNGTLAVTGVTRGLERIGLVAGDIDTAVNGAGNLDRAQNTTPRITLPTGNYGEFITNPAPDAKYLIETNPIYADLGVFFGSDYFLDQVGINPEITNKRLGDALFETDSIGRQIFRQTGKRFLDTAVTGDREQMKRLFDAAVVEKTRLDLTVGIELTAEQMASLGEDIIWMVEREVNGQKVLVPQLYLSSVTLENLDGRGAALVASQTNIEAAEIALANARVEGKTAVTLASTGDLVNRGGAIVSEGDVIVSAERNIDIASGSVSGDNVTLLATNDVVVQTAKTTVRDGINTDDLLHQQARIDAANDVSIVSGNSTALGGAAVQAGGSVEVQSIGNTVVTTASRTDSYDATLGNGFDRRRETTNLGTTITANDNVALRTNSNMAIIGSSVSAEGDADIDVAGNLTIASAQDTVEAESFAQVKKGGFFGSSVSLETTENSTTQVASNITAGNNLTINADIANDGTVSYGDSGDVSITASQLAAEKAAIVHAGGDLSLLAGQDSRSRSEIRKEKTGLVSAISLNPKSVLRDFGDYKDTLDAGGANTVSASITSGTDTELHSGEGDLVLQAASLTSGGETTLSAENGTVALLTATDSDYSSQTSEGESLLWFENAGNGHQDEQVVTTEITADGGLIVKAGNGVVVEYRDTGNLDQSVVALAATPGLEWLDDLKARDDVTWRAVQEAHENWDYKSEGLTGAAAAIIAIVVTIVTAGTGGPAAAAGTSASSAAASAGASTAVAAAAGAAATAGVSALASQATIALINNQGDIGAVLKELGSSASLRSLATTMVTAGVLGGVTGSVGVGKPRFDTSIGAGLGDQIAYQSLRTLTNTVADAAINGTDLGDSLKSNIIGSIANIASAQMAAAIGKFGVDYGIETGDLRKVVMHAIAGCGVGQLSSQNCAAGAIGAGLQEVLGEQIDSMSDDATRRGQIAGLAGAIAVALTGGDAEAVNTASEIANAAWTYNHELHREEVRRITTIAELFAEKEGISVEEAEKRLAQQAYRQEQAGYDMVQGTSGDAAAQKFLALQGLGTLLSDENGDKAFWFTGTEYDRADTNMFSGFLSDPEVQEFYARNGLVTPTEELVALSQKARAEQWDQTLINSAFDLVVIGSSAMGVASIGTIVEGALASCVGTACLYTLANAATEIGAAEIGLTAPATSRMLAGKSGATNTTPGKTIVVDSKGNALVGDWSATKKLTAPENALSHWNKHGAEFPEYSNASQYVKGAQDFVENPPSGTLTKTRTRNGVTDTLLYNPSTNTFAVKTADDAPRTMFKPSNGMTYWNNQ